MPGAGEFKIGSSVPLVTRTGVKATDFQKQIKGAPNGLASEIASQPVADQFFAAKLGLLQKCIGIQWGGGIFTVVGCHTTSGTPWGGPRSGSDVLDTGKTYFAAVSDTKGENWEIQTNVELTSSGGGFACSLHAGVDGTDTILAGGFRTDEFTINTIGETAFLSTPVLARSTDKGKTWTDTGIDRGPIITGFVVNPFEPDIEVALARAGIVTAIAFDPNAKTFLITTLWQDDTLGWFQTYYTGDGSQGWTVVGQTTISDALHSPQGALPLPPWTKDSKVCDNNWFTDDPYGSPSIRFQTNPDVKYCSVNGAGQSMQFTPTGGGSNAPPETITGVSAPITSAAGGRGQQITASSPSGSLSISGGQGLSAFDTVFPPLAGAACISFS